ncbi:MAG: hypothetical protein JSS76_04665 [Bacteroidetes bacterium]|nr:hypothetical protein [Bacteroidota bacterium]
MKAITTCLLICLMLVSCNELKGPSPEVSVLVLIDQTGSEMSLPDVEDVRRLYNLRARDTWGGRFKIEPISDLQYAPSVSFEIAPQEKLMQNPGQRSKAINDFNARISLAFAQVSLQPLGKSKSEIFGPIARALNELASQNVMEKYAIFCSDLHQNSDLFSVYKKSDMDMLYNHPEEVEKIIIKATPINNNLKGVSIQLIYNAPNYESSKRYALIASLFKKICEERGARVIISGGRLES